MKSLSSFEAAVIWDKKGESIHVYDATGNVETHKQAGDFKEP